MAHSQPAAAGDEFAAADGTNGREQDVSDAIALITVGEDELAVALFEHRHIGHGTFS